MNLADAKRVLETALICTQQPMPLRDMRALQVNFRRRDGSRDEDAHQAGGRRFQRQRAGYFKAAQIHPSPV